MRRSWLPVSSTLCGSLLLLSLTACGSSRAPAQTSDTKNRPGADIGTVLRGPDSRFHRTVREVIRDSTRWREVRDSVIDYADSGSEPSVDFRYEILVVAAGGPGGPGDSLVVKRVIRSGQGLRIGVVLYQNCNPEDLSTNPFHVVRVPLSREAVFENKVLRGPHCIASDSR
jgi:hypothetical protein